MKSVRLRMIEKLEDMLDLNIRREFRIHATKWDAIKCMARSLYYEGVNRNKKA